MAQAPGTDRKRLLEESPDIIMGTPLEQRRQFKRLRTACINTVAGFEPAKSPSPQKVEEDDWNPLGKDGDETIHRQLYQGTGDSWDGIWEDI